MSPTRNNNHEISRRRAVNLIGRSAPPIRIHLNIRRRRWCARSAAVRCLGRRCDDGAEGEDDGKPRGSGRQGRG